jgi:hypothetical protein
VSVDTICAHPPAAFRLLDGNGEDDKFPTHDRLMLLELAADLESWPARNIVFRTALDRAARDLVRLAGRAEAGSPSARPG